MAVRTDYQVSIVDPATGATLDLITQRTWQSLQYKRVLNGIGTFAITLPLTYTRAQSYKDTPDLIMEVYRRNVVGMPFEKEDTYLLQISHIYSDESGDDWLTIGGSSLNHLLKRRIVNINDDPNNAGGYLTYQDLASAVMRDLVTYQCITPAVNPGRVIAGLSIGTISGGETVLIRELFGRNLLTVLQEMQASQQTAKADFEVVRSSGVLFEFNATPAGTDRSVTANFPGDPYVLFAPRRGNIISASIKSNSTDEVNAVYVQGEGPENDRDILERTDDTAIATSPWGRREAVTDNRETDYGVTEGLITAGDAFLKKNRIKIEFEVVPDLNSQLAEYNVDWFLGDVVTDRYEGLQADLRISAVQVTANGDGESVIITTENV